MPGTGEPDPSPADPGTADRERDIPQRRIRWRRRATGVAALLVLVGLGWLAVTAVLARTQLLQAKTSLSQLQADVTDQNFASAKAHATELAVRTGRAHRLTSGPVWWIAARLPLVGGPAETIEVAATEVDRLAGTALPTIIEVANGLDPHTLRTANGINLSPLAKAAPAVHDAATVSQTATDRLAGTPAKTWLGAVDRARSSLLQQLTPVNRTLGGVDRAAQLLPSMLGSGGSRRYFIAFQNEAEARGLGGLPGAFAIVTADHGRLAFSYFGNDSALDDVSASVGLAADYTSKWRQAAPASTYINSNIGASMSDAAQIWASMWQRKSGQRVDGAVALDPTALSYLLAVSGPATLPSGEQVTAQDVVPLTEQQVYARFGDNGARKKFLLSVAKAVDERLVSSGNSSGLVKAALTAAGENRLRIYSTHPEEQVILQRTSFAAVPGDHGDAVSGFVVVNAAGSKLDYYLQRAITYQRSQCTAAGAMVRSDIRLLNGAPRSGLPPYVTTRLDAAGATAGSGASRLLVTYYGTPGGQAQSVLLNGRPVASVVSTEDGLLAITVDVEVPVGRAQTVSIVVSEPGADRPVDFLRQPLVQPAQLQATGQASGCR